MRRIHIVALVAWALIAWLQYGGGGSSSPESRKIFVVYEGMDGKPLHGELAVEALRKQGYQVRFIDDDAETPIGAVPDDLAIAIEPARAAGLPALVLVDGGKVKRSLPLPDDAEQIIAEAIR